jgi:hypothetical protein
MKALALYIVHGIWYGYGGYGWRITRVSKGCKCKGVGVEGEGSKSKAGWRWR